ncbi:Hypothetical predicted protein [Olea europaea subsp. europaea]|uniref:Uncharacterized protein n=1 Tax=Olea europaea subsp. europaea TaxID=158383 RepID=A0A8S0TTA9_OLEEU|nr:Hypothetical predicted protein [Olea europaea subsp. europaea]
MDILNRHYAYSKMEMFDPEEKQHQRAQFLIYKALQKAEIRRSRPSWLKVKVFKLKIKIGKRFKTLRKRIGLTLSSAKIGFCKKITCQWKSWKRQIHGKEGINRSLPSMII